MAKLVDLFQPFTLETTHNIILSANRSMRHSLRYVELLRIIFIRNKHHCMNTEMLLKVGQE